MNFDNKKPSNEGKIKNAYIIDKHPLMCKGYETILSENFNDLIIKKCTNIKKIKSLKILNSTSSLIIIDIFNISEDSLQELIDLKTSYPKALIAISTSLKDPESIERCMSLGAIGFIPKSTPTFMIKRALKVISLGIQWLPKQPVVTQNKKENSLLNEPHELSSGPIHPIENFTQKELLTLRHLIDGLVNRDIAKNLNVTESTTKSHVSSIIKKMGVYNRTQVFCEFKKINQKSYENKRMHSKAQ